MTISEMEPHLNSNTFESFRLNLNNGQSFDVRHPERAILPDTCELYIFKPSHHESLARRSAGLLAIGALHNISTLSTLEPLAGRAA